MIKKYETKDPIDPDKQLPSAAAHIDKSLFASIATVPIVATKYLVFPSAQMPASLSSIYTSIKPSSISEVTGVVTRASVDIMTRIPIEKKEQYFNVLLLKF